MMFDFEWINANLYGGLYTPHQELFRRIRTASTGRPASAAERALLAPFPGAVRDDIIEGRWRPPRDRRLGRRPDDAASAPSNCWTGGLRA